MMFSHDSLKANPRPLKLQNLPQHRIFRKAVHLDFSVDIAFVLKFYIFGLVVHPDILYLQQVLQAEVPDLVLLAISVEIVQPFFMAGLLGIFHAQNLVREGGQLCAVLVRRNDDVLARARGFGLHENVGGCPLDLV